MSKEKTSPKTILELVALHDAWKRTFREGAMGNHEAYNQARDSRHHFEEEKWIPVKGLVAELQKRKIGYTTMNKACADNVTEMKNLEDPKRLNEAEEYLQIISKLYSRASEIDWVLGLLEKKEVE